MPRVLPSIAVGFNGNAHVEYHDLKSTRDRPAAGLDHEVLASFREEISPNRADAVGVIGWTFTQNDLTYACRIKDDNNNDVYGFGLEIPRGQEYLHPSHNLSIAEKAHILMVIEQSLSADKRSQHRHAFFELEKACFQESLGIVTKIPRFPNFGFTPQGYVKAYCGLTFTHDQDSLASLRNKEAIAPPEPAVLCLEWDRDGKTYTIDCSHAIPRFQIGYAANPNVSKLNMTRAEAKEAVHYARVRLNASNAELSKMCDATGLWVRLGSTAEWLSMFRQPS